MARPNLFLEPISRFIFPVTEQDGARIDLAHKHEQLASIRMRGEIEVTNFTQTGHLSTTGTEQKCLSMRGRSEPATRSIRIGIAYEKNRLRFVADHAQS